MARVSSLPLLPVDARERAAAGRSRTIHGDRSCPIRAKGNPLGSAKGLEKTARSSEARWILWHEGPAIDLPELTAAETFAVSSQPYFRAWKPSLFPMASFGLYSPGSTAGFWLRWGPAPWWTGGSFSHSESPIAA